MLGLWPFSLLVNAQLGGLLGLAYVAIRFVYGHTFRNSAGQTWKQRNLGRYTIPAYFIAGGMTIATTFHVFMNRSH